MVPSLLLRPARPADAPVVASYNQALARETEHRELDPARVLAGVEAVLADPSKGRYLVAEFGGRVIGQLMLTWEWSDWRNGVFWWIQSVYVDPDHRGCGVFSALYRQVEADARAAENVCGIRLYMEPGNDRARGAYLRLGLRPAGYELLEKDFVMGAG